LIKANPFKRDTKQDLERTLPKRRTANRERNKHEKQRNKKKTINTKKKGKKINEQLHCPNTTSFTEQKARWALQNISPFFQHERGYCRKNPQRMRDCKASSHEADLRLNIEPVQLSPLTFRDAPHDSRSGNQKSSN